MSPNTPERFREVEPLCILGEMELAICPSAKDIKVRMWTDDSRAYLTIPEAGALRDWLTKALPEEHAHTDACWEPDTCCDMGRNERYVQVAPRCSVCGLPHEGLTGYNHEFAATSRSKALPEEKP